MTVGVHTTITSHHSTAQGNTYGTVQYVHTHTHTHTHTGHTHVYSSTQQMNGINGYYVKYVHSSIMTVMLFLAACMW